MESFDPALDFDIVYRRLPHWSQPGAMAFITWRTWDPMPEKVIRQWQRERAAWLHQHGITTTTSDWEAQAKRLPPALQRKLRCILSDRWNENLDACHGACVLRRPELSQIVADSLLHFDGDRYEMSDFVVMPNHVHILAAFPRSEAMLEQCESWKHYTATRINRHLGVRGRFWMQDGFDHLVRPQEQFEFLRNYVASNPLKAKLKAGEYRLYSSRSA